MLRTWLCPLIGSAMGGRLLVDIIPAAVSSKCPSKWCKFRSQLQPCV